MIRIVFLLLFLASYACATTFTCQEGMSGPANCGNEDGLIWGDAPTTNYGTLNQLGVGFCSVSIPERTIIKFDLSSIGTPNTISDCVIDLNIDNLVTPTVGTMARVLLSDVATGWAEASATWNIYKTSNNWMTAGASSDGNDIKSSGTGNDAPVAYTAPTVTGHFNFGGLALMCQDALDNRSGILLLWMNQDTLNCAKWWTSTSSDGATSSQRPKLTVTYTAPVSLGTRMRKLFGVGRRGPWWPEDYEPHPFQFFIPWED